MSMPGPIELMVIFLIVILLFGAKRLPELGQSLGKGIRYFKEGLSGKILDNAEIKEKEKV